jgi:hypothetical protein
MMLRDPREQLMRQHCSIDHDHHTRIMPLARHDASPAITHQLVSSRGFAPLPRRCTTERTFGWPMMFRRLAICRTGGDLRKSVVLAQAGESAARSVGNFSAVPHDNL